MALSPFHSEILDRLVRVRRKTLRLELAYGLMAFFLAAAAVVLAVAVPNQIFSFGTAGRTVIFTLGILALGAAFGWFALRPLLRLWGITGVEGLESLAL